MSIFIKTILLFLLFVNPCYGEVERRDWVRTGNDIYYNRGNVGIGTTAPTDKLDISGGVKIGSSYAGIGTTAPANGMIIEGSVGIGATSSSGYKLLVSGNTLSNRFVVGPGTAAAPTIINVNSWGDGLFFPSNTAVAIATNYLERMRLDSSGNVGIGTTAPWEELTVSGDAAISDTSPHLAFRDSTDNTAYMWHLDSADASFPYLTLWRGTDSGSGFTVISPYTPLLQFDSSDNIKMKTSTSHFILPYNTDPETPVLSFGDGDTGFYESADDSLGLALGGARKWLFAGNYLRGGTDGTAALVNTTPSSTTPTILPAETDTNTGMGRAASDVLSLIAGGTNALNCTTTGVGIGMTDPGEPLQVLTDSGGEAIAIEENSGDEQWELGVDSAGSLNFQDSGTSTAVFYDGGNYCFATGTGADTTPDTDFVVQASDASTTPALEVDQLSTGDAAMMFSISGDCFALGIDNSASDIFTLAYSNTAGSAVLGTSNLLTMDASGNMDVVGTLTASTMAADSTVSSTTTTTVGTFLRHTQNNHNIPDDLIPLTPAAYNLTPATSYVHLNCLDADGANITVMEDAPPVDGQIVYIANDSAVACNFADQANVLDIAGAFAMGQNDTLTLLYMDDIWIELARSNN